jgi:hypothetical protein
MVRRNDPSSKLAMEVAHELVEKFAGLITWDGIHYWEALYIRLFPKVTRSRRYGAQGWNPVSPKLRL